jgi:hypothetical protein
MKFLREEKEEQIPVLYTVVLYNNLLLLLQMHRRERWRLFGWHISACLGLLPPTEYYSLYQPNTIHFTCRTPSWIQDSSGPSECLHLSPLSLYFLDEIEIIQFSSICWQHNKLDKVISIRQRKDKLRGTDICWQAKNFTLTGQYCHYYNWLWKKDNTNSSPRSKMIVK